MSHATKELNAEKEKAAEEVRAIDLKLMEAIGAIEDADNEKNDLLDKLGETKKALEASESKNSLLIVDKATLTAVNGELKKKVEILEASVLKGQMNYEQLERKHAEDLNQLRGAQAEEVSALKVEAARMEAARDAASEEAKKYLQRLAEESKESKAVVAKLEQKLESLTKEKDEVVKKASGLAGQLEAVEKHNGELLATIKSGQARK
jgi:chromosome segregation ATPase